MGQPLRPRPYSPSRAPGWRGACIRADDPSIRYPLSRAHEPESRLRAGRESSMRYRQLRYRYALIVGGGQPRPLGELRPGERLGVTVAQPRWRPAADVCETPAGFDVTVELAGAD